MSLRTKSLLFLLAAASLWSLSGVLVKTIDWNPLALASSRSLVAGFTIIFLTRRTLDRRPPSRPQWWGAVFMALVGLTFVSATKLTTAANAILLQYTAPVWVAIFAPLVLRERTSGRDWFFIALTFGGMAMFFMDSVSAEGFWGIILAIMSGLAFAALPMALRYVKDDQPFKCLIYGNFLLFLVGLPFWRAPYPDLGDVGLIIFAGVVQYGLPYYLYALASKGVSTLEMVLVTALEPILNPIWVFLAIGEQPGLWSLIGGAVVLLTITAWSVLKTVRPSPAVQ
ncbi:MAG: DMT family transporter [Candidatus Adiutrix sp.]|jgi:drug/metabolite transporter (DMT)-like permease|nr:DMT family transporter [Candidatus Adiutrix sp.]